MKYVTLLKPSFKALVVCSGLALFAIMFFVEDKQNEKRIDAANVALDNHIHIGSSRSEVLQTLKRANIIPSRSNNHFKIYVVRRVSGSIFIFPPAVTFDTYTFDSSDKLINIHVITTLEALAGKK
jgi:cell division protein YceG involved in septum cleavage